MSSCTLSSTSVIAESSVSESGYNEDYFINFDLISLLLVATRLHGMSLIYPPGFLLNETQFALKRVVIGEVTFQGKHAALKTSKDPIIAASIPTKSPMLNHSINSKDHHKMAVVSFLLYVGCVD